MHSLVTAALVIAITTVSAGCASDRICGPDGYTSEWDVAHCLDARQGPCEPRLPVRLGELGEEPGTRCTGIGGEGPCQGLTNAEVTYRDGRARLRVVLYGGFRRGGLWGSRFLIDVPSFIEDGALGSVCEYRYSDLFDGTCRLTFGQCATEGAITMEPDGGGRATATFPDGASIDTRWRP